METFYTYLNQLWHLMNELSPWLLFGLLLAGILHVLLPTGFIRRHLGGRRFVNVLKAVLVGVPMPLCSCGVIPTAIGLKKDGASDGAAMGFLISTPQTGVDSILVSASFLGWPFAIFKVLSAFVSGLIGGLLVNAADGSENKPQTENKTAQSCCCSKDEPEIPGAQQMLNMQNQSNAPEKTNSRHWREIFSFGLVQLLRDIYRWLIVGVVVAALISTLIPAGRLQEIPWTQGLPGMIMMLLISLPMYICATASVPLAASLVIAGMSPGAALVLLMAGPTTNIATMGAILRSFGKKVLTIYLATVALMSITMGLLFDWLLLDISTELGHVHPLPGWLESGAALVLIGFLVYFAATDIGKFLKPKKKTHSCCNSKP